MRSPVTIRRNGLCFCAALWMLGCSETAGPSLTDQLQSTNPDVRRGAALELGRLGDASADAVPLLMTAAGDTDPDVRQAACRALGQIPSQADQSLPALRPALKDPEISVRLAAAFALLKLNPASREFVPVITEAMRQGEGGTIVAVGQLGASADWAEPTLIKLLRDARPGIRRISAEALGRIGPDADAIAALQKATQDPDDRVRAAATAALSPR